MTREEAIKIFLNRGWITLEGGTYFDGDKWREAIMIISDYFRNEYKEQGGDAVSRQAVLDVTWEEPSYTDALNVLTEVRDKVKVLPSVTPQQRMGRWIEVIDETDSFGNKTWHHECSICGSDKSGCGWGTYKHCPDCGTKMEVEE